MTEITAGTEVMVPFYSRKRQDDGTYAPLAPTASRYRSTVQRLETRNGVPGAVLARSLHHEGGGTKWLPVELLEVVGSLFEGFRAQPAYEEARDDSGRLIYRRKVS